MRKSIPWQALTALLTAACLILPVSVQAVSGPALQPAQAQEELRELTPEDLAWLAASNAREDRLTRYTSWAEQYPQLTPEEVVFQVNLDLDRVPYDSPRTVADPDSLTVLVNKHNALPDGYVPELELLGAGYGSGSLRPEAAQAFRAMADAARAEGISLRSVSAYRSYQHQKSTYNRYLTQYRQKTVDTFSARPGHSEHQTGLALDINTASTRSHFERTPAFAWLQEHCAQFGFLLRYGQEKQEITGYRFEPWHYRYVGVEIARVCMDQGLSYEEYLALGLKPEESVPDPETSPETDPPQETQSPQAPEAVQPERPPQAPETAPVPEAAPSAMPPFPIGQGSPFDL